MYIFESQKARERETLVSNSLLGNSSSLEIIDAMDESFRLWVGEIYILVINTFCHDIVLTITTANVALPIQSLEFISTSFISMINS